MRYTEITQAISRVWFVLDTIAAALFVALVIFILTIRPLPNLWQNVLAFGLGVLEIVLWRWTQRHRNEPEKARPVFLRVTVLAWSVLWGSMFFVHVAQHRWW